MKSYRIRTVVGGSVAFFVGGSVITFEIEDVSTGNREYYTLFGADFGFSLPWKLFNNAASHLTSGWTDFTANVGIKDFHGYVIVKSASLKAGIGGEGMVLDFITGPAAGTQVSGIGWGTGISAGVTATHGYMMYRGD